MQPPSNAGKESYVHGNEVPLPDSPKSGVDEVIERFITRHRADLAACCTQNEQPMTSRFLRDMSGSSAIEDLVEKTHLALFPQQLLSSAREDVGSLVKLGMALAYESMSGRKLPSYSFEGVELILVDDCLYILHEEKTLPPQEKQRITEKMKEDPSVPQVFKNAGRSGNVSALSKADFDAIAAFSLEMVAELQKAYVKKVEGQSSTQEPANKGVMQEAPMNFVLAAHATAIRLIASDVLRSFREQERSFEKEIQKERDAAKHEKVEAEKIKENNYRMLLKSILREEIERFELLMSVVAAERDIKEYGYDVPG